MKMFSIAALSLLGFISPAHSAEGNNPLADISRIECERVDGAQDFVTIIPNVFEREGKTFAVVSGKSTYLYEVKIENDGRGMSLIRFVDQKYQFQTDREVSLTTADFKTGHFLKVALQPGVGGYGRGGIPQGTTLNQIYACEFVSR